MDTTVENKGSRPRKCDDLRTIKERGRDYRAGKIKKGYKSVQFYIMTDRLEKIDKMAKARGVSRMDLINFILGKVIDRANIERPNKLKDSF